MAFRAVRSSKRRPMRARSTAYSRRSVAPRWLGLRANSIPGPFTECAPGAEMLKLASLALLIIAWFVGSWLAGEHLLPAPTTVLNAILAEARSGELFYQIGVTLARVLVAFTLAMTIGSAIGLAMGRFRLVNQLGDSWLVILLNLSARVIIVLAYLWGGLTELAAILAVAINKLPTAIVTIREGARALDPALDEMAHVFAMPRLKTLRHVVIPQLAPYFAAAGRSGLSLVW